MAIENKDVIRRFVDELCNGRKLNVADEILAENHSHHDPANPGVGTGPAATKELVAMYQTAFPDVLWNVDEMFEAGDRVVARWTATGTQTGDLPGLPATGRLGTVNGIWIFRLQDGKIAESWSSWDALGMYQQLGVMPQMRRSAGG
jgi:steroid delta-isomerase-like uncharacterized protein